MTLATSWQRRRATLHLSLRGGRTFLRRMSPLSISCRAIGSHGSRWRRSLSRSSSFIGSRIYLPKRIWPLRNIDGASGRKTKLVTRRFCGTRGKRGGRAGGVRESGIRGSGALSYDNFRAIRELSRAGPNRNAQCSHWYGGILPFYGFFGGIKSSLSKLASIVCLATALH
jgi:hypothetical protein